MASPQPHSSQQSSPEPNVVRQAHTQPSRFTSTSDTTSSPAQQLNRNQAESSNTINDGRPSSSRPRVTSSLTPFAPISLILAASERPLPSAARLREYHEGLIKVVSALDPLKLDDDEAVPLGAFAKLENPMGKDEVEQSEQRIASLFCPPKSGQQQDGDKPWVSDSYDYNEPLEPLWRREEGAALPLLDYDDGDTAAAGNLYRSSEGEEAGEAIEEAYTDEQGRPLAVHLATNDEEKVEGQQQLAEQECEGEEEEVVLEEEEEAATTRARKRLRT